MRARFAHFRLDDSPGATTFEEDIVIATDLTGDPAIPSQVQFAASLIAFASELQFLTEQGPQ
jgi:hypothetical protein